MSQSHDPPPNEPQRPPSASAVPVESSVESPADELVARWHRGQRVPVEAFLQRYTQLSDDEAFELVLTEVVLREEFQEPATLEEYLWRFPRFADRLRRHFALHASLSASSSADLGKDSTVTESPNVRKQSETLPTVPGFDQLEELGRGGMGVVYRAREASLGRDVALKFLPAEYAGDQDRLQRFLREARTASALNHPNICTVHALAEHEGGLFIVMEFVEGLTLQELVSRRPSFREAARWLRQAARALAAAHAEGVVHRDIKPENIMVRDDGYVKVLDFGLARQLPSFIQDRSDDGRSTCPGAMLGTLAYMSPEQTRGEPAESASDIFALGVVLYQLLAGRHPFEADSPLEMLHAIATRPAIPLARVNPAVPVAVEGLVEAMLHKDPRLRPSALEVEAMLARLTSAEGQRTAARAASQAVVHRQRELAVLRTALEKADGGAGCLLCLSGEPGIGKTTLAHDFLGSLAAEGRTCLVGRGRCSERQADTEAYLPVVDALEDLLRGEGSDSVARLMQLVAPTWYAQLAPSADQRFRGNESDLAATLDSSAESWTPDSAPRASSQQAMLREFSKLLTEISRLGTLVLFLDDVHWADAATVDLLAHIGRHCTGLRLLVLATFRPTELLLGPHPFHGVKLDLQGRGVCTELAVGFLERPHVQAYLSLIFPEHAFPADFAELIHQATEGSPLFMADLLRYLRERGVIAQQCDRWSLARELPDLQLELPGSVRSMIQRKLELLADDDRRLLAAASVQGHEFDSAAVAGALALDAATAEERLETLDRVHGLVRLLREDEFPDRTLTLRFAFVHVLYQQALYASLQPTRRAALGMLLARTLEAHYGESSAAAAHIAWLYEVGRDFFRAAKHFALAAQNAASVFAHREAIVLARRGLRLLESAPPSPHRAALELRLQTTLGMQLQMTHGFAAPEVSLVYSRARELCEQVPGSASLFPVLWGLWLFSKVRSELVRAREMALELSALAHEMRDPDLAIQAHQALGMTAFCRGESAVACQHAEKTAELYDGQRHYTHSYLFGQDPGVMCRSFGAISLWLLGYPEQAIRQMQSAIGMSRRLSPSSQAVAMHFASMLHQVRRDGPQVRACAEACRAISDEHGFSFWHAASSVLTGWALTESGLVQEGLGGMRQGLKDWTATNSVTYQTYFLALLAEALRRQGELAEGCTVIDNALNLVEQTDERFYEAELWRLKGEFLFADDPRQAVDCLFRAISIAREQQAKSLELRAAMSLVRHCNGRIPLADAAPRLAEVYSWFTEGLDTPDLQDAAALLSQGRSETPSSRK